MLILDYNGINNIYSDIIKYASSSSDAFLLVYQCSFPYTQTPPKYTEEMISADLEPFLIKQYKNAKQWPGAKTNAKNRVVNIYKCCKETRNILIQVGKISDWGNGELPGDLCFIRKNKAWFVTISHEKLCFVYGETQDDIKYFNKIGLNYYVSDESKNYIVDYQ